MRITHELSTEDLEVQRTELLPAREALQSINFAEVEALNVGAAVNFESEEAEAEAAAKQTIAVVQEN
ncbi:MAG: hypothetical protein ACRDPK_19340 [Carbonactinosporaceae bacterium]